MHDMKDAEMTGSYHHHIRICDDRSLKEGVAVMWEKDQVRRV